MGDCLTPPPQAISLLEADPDLGNGLTTDERAIATRYAVARLLEIDEGIWDPGPISAAAEDGWLGLFLVEGLVLRRVTVGKRSACELFGLGDLLRPWDTDGEYDPLPISLDWVALTPARAAVLDTTFTLRIARWPSITSRLVCRVAQRARYLALTQAVTHLPRTHPRLLMLFWLLAERWGRVSSDGVRVNLPLTHEILAVLVGSHRPTVTIALQRLGRAGLLIREHSDQWLLTKRATELLAHPESLALIGEGDEGEPGEPAARAGAASPA